MGRRYALLGQRMVRGYLHPQVLATIGILDKAQAAHGVEGSVVEVGVHHGRLLIGLMLLRNGPALAIDLFGAQELNVDNSGHGDLDVFLSNVDRWASREGLEIIEGDSTEVGPTDIRQKVGLVRWFSVDGGHTAGIVESDMRLAEECLTVGGIVVADDVFNPQWPGVAEGIYRYLMEGGLVPFLIADNKTYFTRPDWAPQYRQAILDAYSGRWLVEPVEQRMCGSDVIVLVRVPKTVPHLLRRSEKARQLYHAVLG